MLVCDEAHAGLERIPDDQRRAPCIKARETFALECFSENSNRAFALGKNLNRVGEL